jgi:predicted nucleic acid-binding protein
VLLLDHSAWSRLLLKGMVRQERARAIVAEIAEERVATCLPFLLEAGYSARSAADHRRIADRLGGLPRIPVDREVERLAFEAQRELAEVGHHRLAPTDVLIAACAHRAEGGVLHYDRDYDLLAAHTSLRFESEWLVPAGSL